MDCKYLSGGVVMFDKLGKIENKYREIEKSFMDQEVLSNSNLYQKKAKLHAELAPIVKKYDEYKKVVDELEFAQEMMKTEDDKEMIKFAKEEMEELSNQKEKLVDELKLMLIPKDPNDKKNSILEIRAGTGGEEAGLFAADLFRMYSKYAEMNNWSVKVLNLHETGLKGFKEIVFSVNGKGVYSRLKYEGGVHRVQRVPVTESSGRIHTSAVSVAVLPEAEAVDIKIDPSDLKIDTYRSSGPGGQHVNTTDSAVRITHVPTDTTVTCQDEKSQHKNKKQAMKILRARLMEKERQEKEAERAETRRSMVGSGDRSEKIRTYNFPQNRVTDHRINMSLYQLESVMDGGLNEIIDGLTEADQEEKLKEL